MNDRCLPGICDGSQSLLFFIDFLHLVGINDLCFLLLLLALSFLKSLIDLFELLLDLLEHVPEVLNWIVLILLDNPSGVGEGLLTFIISEEIKVCFHVVVSYLASLIVLVLLNFGNINSFENCDGLVNSVLELEEVSQLQLVFGREVELAVRV